MTSRPNLPALTSARFFAALYVVVFHGAKSYVHIAIARSFVGTGYVAVDFFFVLSGFVLAYRYCSDDGILVASAREFWIARLARIYPVYLVGLAVGAPLYLRTLFTDHAFGLTLVKAAIAGMAAFVLLQSWLYRIATAWNTPAWSLSVEAFLYAVFPWLLPRLVAALRRWGPAVFAVLWALALAAPVLYCIVAPDGPGSVQVSSSGTWLEVLRFLPAVHLPAFAIGVAAGWYHLRRDRRAEPASRWLGATAALTLAALCTGAWLPYPMLHSGLFAPLFAALIYCLAGSRGLAVRALSHRWLVALGDASYALYLLHFPLLQYATDAAGGGLSLVQFIGVVIVIQIICLAVYRFIEIPARGWVRRSFAREARPTV
jgi:peptidoglycan/LPS O-acetylase OafA/YrhL